VTALHSKSRRHKTPFLKASAECCVSASRCLSWRTKPACHGLLRASCVHPPSCTSPGRYEALHADPRSVVSCVPAVIHTCSRMHSCRCSHTGAALRDACHPALVTGQHAVAECATVPIDRGCQTARSAVHGLMHQAATTASHIAWQESITWRVATYVSTWPHICGLGSKPSAAQCQCSQCRIRNVTTVLHLRQPATEQSPTVIPMRSKCALFATCARLHSLARSLKHIGAAWLIPLGKADQSAHCNRTSASHMC